MTRPTRFLARMALFLAAAFAAVLTIWRPALDAFMANPPLNGVIVGVFFVGVFVCVRQAWRLTDEIRWVEAFRLRGAEQAAARSPSLLAPIARALSETGPRKSLAGASARALLDGLGSRLDESRELARYLLGLLIFLGLLGTFWGLLETVRSVGDVIDGLAVDQGAAGDTFGRLQSGLRAPLDGMGTAFSSSLFGLAGALALGFLDLQAGQAQNRFFMDVEDWISGMTRFQSATALGDGEGPAASTSAYVEALLGQTAETLDDLSRLVARGEEGRRETQQALARTG
ncbi:MAG: flagellar motor protein MotA, partial [Alphaproteobacteria bacterium]